MRTLLCAVLALGPMLAEGCKDGPAHLMPGQIVTVRGLLEPGAECPMIVTRDGHRYSLGGDLGRFTIGDRVCLKGAVAEVSTCMAGEANIAITAIGPEGSCP